MPWLVAGLGNPGDGYADTRHNLGARVVESLARAAGTRLRKTRFVPVEVAEVPFDGDRVWLVRSLRYMNESGPSYASVARKHDVPPDHVIAVHDEIDLPLGALRVKAGGSTAGHNGLRSLQGALGTADFVRVRLGVGRPPGRKDPADHVLDRFAAREREEADLLVADGADAVWSVIRDGIGATQDRFNRSGPRTE